MPRSARPDSRGSNYLEIIAAAKAKALETLDDPEPRLTKLELAFRNKFLDERLT